MSDPRSDIDKYLSNYLSGELSEGELAEIEQWLAADELNQEQLDSLKAIWETEIGYPDMVNSEEQRHELWDRLQGNDTINNKSWRGHFRFANYLKYAAVFIFLLGITYVIWFNKEDQQPVSVAETLVERTNPLGQKSKIQLPDGSLVWLNAGSKLAYSSDYNEESRQVQLTGEAHFNVVKNPNLPFKVLTDELMITALGTSFNVEAFVSGQEEVALNTGKVKVECLNEHGSCPPSYLNPGQLASFNKSIGSIKLSTFEGLDPFGWKDGRIVFNHASFKEVLETLSRWYNVEFEVDGSLNQEWNYSTTFDNEVLENVLLSLKFSEKIDFQINGSVVNIKI
jgi:transmembrane sensor